MQLVLLHSSALHSYSPFYRTQSTSIKLWLKSLGKFHLGSASRIVLNIHPSGKMFPLTMADRLGDYIAGTAIETIETEKLVKQYSSDIVDSVYGQSRPLEEVMADIHKKLKNDNIKMNSFEVEDVYKPSATMDKNIDIWKKSEKVSDGLGAVRAVCSLPLLVVMSCMLIRAHEQVRKSRMREEYTSGTAAPEVSLRNSEVQYAQVSVF